MRIVPLQSANLIDLKVLFYKVKDDFVPTKKRSKPTPIEKYLTNTPHRMLIAIQGETVVGYIAYNTTQKRILNLAVVRELRSQGLGTELVKRALMEIKAKGAKSATIKTWESNAPSIAMLEAIGFRRYKTVPDDRMTGEATWQYRKKL